jgi:hypothetical protein
MTTRKRTSKSKPEGTSLEELPALSPPQPPTFPSFKELVELDTTEQLQPQKSRRLLDLFDGTLGDLTPLLEDFRRSPEKYGNESQSLLEQLESGNKSVGQLNSHERRLLNLATFDYHQAPSPKRPNPVQRAAASSAGTTTRKQRLKHRKTEKPRPGVDIPVTELPAYWWMS